MAEARAYACSKCGCSEYKEGRIRTTGSGLSRFLNLQNQQFLTVSCGECGYTEVYRIGGGSKVASVFDVLSN